MAKNILHITTRQAWQEARENGFYLTPGLSTEGFIHCSFPYQLERVANKYYAGQRDLIILVIDPDCLASDLILEEAVDVEDEFPHIYGQLNLDAVIRVVNLEAGVDGCFTLPTDLEN